MKEFQKNFFFNDFQLSFRLQAIIFKISRICFSSYEFPNGESGHEGWKFILGGFDHSFQTDEIEAFQFL